MKFPLLPMALLGLFAVVPARAQTNHSLPGLNADIASAAVQLSNGRIVVAGAFTGFSGVLIPGIVRLKTDGTLDTNFQLDATVASTPFGQGHARVALQTDGKVLVFGADSKITGTVQKDIVRLTRGGQVDPTFTAAADLDFQGVGLAVGEADGTVLVDTGFDKIGGANPAIYHLTRLLADGSEDVGFQAVSISNPSLGYPSGAHLSAMTVQLDGKILLAGNFSVVGGASHVALARLNADGSVDASFSPAFGLDSLDSASPITVSAVAVRTDGGVIISGTFAEIDGVARAGFALLKADGTLDPGFVPDANITGAAGKMVAMQPGGEILVTQLNPSTGSTLSIQLERLNADGSLDTGFAAPSVSRAIKTVSGNVLNLYGVLAYADGTVIAAGNFSAVNATPRNAVVLLDADGTVNLGRAQSYVEIAAQAGGFLLTRTSGDKTLAVTVNYKLKGNAVAGTDYAALSGSAKIKAGKTKKAIHVTALTNAAAGKTLKLTLKAGDGYSVESGENAKYLLPSTP